MDPAVIMLVACGDWLLLGRQARWAPGRFSLLAGLPPVPLSLYSPNRWCTAAAVSIMGWFKVP